MLRRWLVGLGVSAVLSAGCSWVFQTRVARKKGRHYHGTSEPDCTTGIGWPVVDGVFAILNGASAVLAAADETVENRSIYIISGVAWTVIHVASAASGSSWSGDCEEAMKEWEENKADDIADKADDRARRRAEEEREAAPPPVRPAAPKEKAPPRGFFCSASSASPTAALCTRIKSDCLRARAAGLGAVPDLSECTLMETAHCFDAGGGEEDRCAPTVESCEAQRALAATSNANPGDCVALY